ncbi:IS110 family transposase [Mycolicibacterium brumae]|uniref:IS110 family transposase n=1 Tax=Mycolicibacterium brumae TaxID=85968 RepID=A0A2G5P6G0_9MYCO
MEVIHPRCAGLDISKRDAKVCVRINGAGRRKTTETVTTFGATTRQIMALRDHLVAQKVSCVVMEATGDYWKPFYYLLEDLAEVEVMLVNARHVKNLPGRKTDVADATWLAQLGAHGLVRGSFVPPPPIRALRDLTRTRTAVTRERTREIQRLEKLLEDAGIKLSSVAADLNGKSSRAMIAALLAGQTATAVMADLAQKQLRRKIPELTEALYGRFTEHHAFLTRMHLALIDQHTAAIEALTERIEVVMEPFRHFRGLICTIPGIGGLTADVVVAETGADMAKFPTAAHLASWAGAAPGNNESAGKVKSRRTRPGNPYLQGALGTAAMSISHTRDTYLGAKYRRIAARRGPLRANVAIQRALLVAIWNIATTDTAYRDPGGDYFTRLNPQKARSNAVRQLEAMGYHVTLSNDQNLWMTLGEGA